ncbi:hypothetical protein R1flu_002420 [Riccia fluitans]|uniref:UV radiation resistance-associated gene protein n=1 Tax=Riccia fluitans TaxID=41844 RepID=A0ABD1Y638_9MARC
MGSQEPELGNRSSSVDDEGEKEVKVVDWAEFHDVFYELGGIALKVIQLKAKKAALSGRLESLIEEGSKSKERLDCLENLKKRLQDKQDVLDRATDSLQESQDKLKSTKEKLLPTAQALLKSAKALAGAQSRLQEADRLLSGEGGHCRLNHLRKQLDARRRQMAGQVASLYPLATCTHSGSSNSKQTQQAIANSSLSGPATPSPAVADGPSNSRATSGDAPASSGEETSIAIAGLQLVVPVKKQPGLFNEKSDLETSATALGYVAHAVTLIASYLDIPLRYPVRLGGSRSYIQDYSPPAEPSMETGAIAFPTGQSKPGVEFPLFSENQEITRSAYAVFLLNKDLEQILNRLGFDSVGPRHTLPNLSRLFNAVTSGAVPLS